MENNESCDIVIDQVLDGENLSIKFIEFNKLSSKEKSLQNCDEFCKVSDTMNCVSEVNSEQYYFCNRNINDIGNDMKNIYIDNTKCIQFKNENNKNVVLESEPDHAGNADAKQSFNQGSDKAVKRVISQKLADNKICYLVEPNNAISYKCDVIQNQSSVCTDTNINKCDDVNRVDNQQVTNIDDFKNITTVNLPECEQNVAADADIIDNASGFNITDICNKNNFIYDNVDYNQCDNLVISSNFCECKSESDVSVIVQNDKPFVYYKRMRSYSLSDAIKNKRDKVTYQYKVRKRRVFSMSDSYNHQVDVTGSSTDIPEVDIRSFTPSVEIITVNPNEDSMDSEFDFRHDRNLSIREQQSDNNSQKEPWIPENFKDGLPHIKLEDIDHVVNSCDLVNLKVEEVTANLNSTEKNTALADNLTGAIGLDELKDADISLVENQEIIIKEENENDEIISPKVKLMSDNLYNDLSKIGDNKILNIKREVNNYDYSTLNDDGRCNTEIVYNDLTETKANKNKKSPEHLGSILKTIADFSPPVKNVLYDVYVQTPGRSLLKPQTTPDLPTSPIFNDGNYKKEGKSLSKKWLDNTINGISPVSITNIKEDLSDDALEFDLASYITEEDCAGLSLPPSLQTIATDFDTDLSKVTTSCATGFDATNNSRNITKLDIKQNKETKINLTNDYCSSVETGAFNSSFSGEDELLDVVSNDDKIQIPRNLKLKANGTSTGKCLGVGIGKNIKTMSIPDTDDSEIEADFYDESSNDSDDSKKNDPDYCVDTDMPFSKKVSNKKRKNSMYHQDKRILDQKCKFEDMIAQKKPKSKNIKNESKSKLTDLSKKFIKKDFQTVFKPVAQNYKQRKESGIFAEKTELTENVSNGSNNINSIILLDKSEIANNVCSNKNQEKHSDYTISEDNDYNKNIKQTKRKLNLQEYKMRKKGDLKCPQNIEITSSSPNNISNLKNVNMSLKEKNLLSKTGTSDNTPTAKMSPTQIHNYEVTNNSITNTLKTEIKHNSSKVMMKPNLNTLNKSAPITKTKVFDPIGDASRKALMLKKNARKEQDIEHMIPVIPHSAIVPLEIMSEPKDESKQSEPEILKKVNPEYEEIVLVSIGINTIVSKVFCRSPSATATQKLGLSNNYLEQHDKSKLKVLVDINDAIRSKKDVKITSNSLLSSIQDIILKTASPQSDRIGDDKTDDSSIHEQTQNMANVEYGEDKVIMHLRKDRQRSKVINVACQVDLDTSFEPLEKLKLLNAVKSESRKLNELCKRSRSRNRSRSNSKRRKSDNSFSTRSPESRQRSRKSRQRQQTSKPSRHASRSKSRSHCSTRYRRSRCSVSSTTSRSSSGEYSRRSRSIDRSISRSSSSRSRSRSRSRNRNYRSQKNKNGSNRNNTNNERRIVFIGHLKESATHNDLKQLFNKYGQIISVSLHSKDNGMRYGFVTFTTARSAYDAVEKAPRDPRLKNYNVGFGGRRQFCDSSYADLDGVAVMSHQNDECIMPSQKMKTFGDITPTGFNCGTGTAVANNVGFDCETDSFEALLAEMKEKLAKNKRNK